MIIMEIPADRSIKDSWDFVTAENLVTEIVQLLKIEEARRWFYYIWFITNQYIVQINQ